MSEFQYVAFRAIDGPVSGENLEYMQSQSSRAEVTPWAFENEYNYGDFRGNALEMLRRGYDFHLHYANYGVRRLIIRLPLGLPDPDAATPYLTDDSLRFVADKKGPGGSLVIQPFNDDGGAEDLWDVATFVDRLIPLRSEILDGDLRPFYLAHLAVRGNVNHCEDPKEGPVPAGLDQLTDAQIAMAQYLDIGKSVIAAAAQGCPPLPKVSDIAKRHSTWLKKQSSATKDAWLARLLATPHTTVRAEMLAAFLKDHPAPPWPTATLNRTISALEEAAVGIAKEAKRIADAEAARQRAEKLARIAADPNVSIQKAEELISIRSSRSYAQAGDILVDLRDALANTPKKNLAAEQARRLKGLHPTARGLATELRKRGFLPK